MDEIILKQSPVQSPCNIEENSPNIEDYTSSHMDNNTCIQEEYGLIGPMISP